MERAALGIAADKQLGGSHSHRSFLGLTRTLSRKGNPGSSQDDPGVFWGAMLFIER